jgi:hypothetical protein
MLFEDYVVSVFNFINKFLRSDGASCFSTLTISMFWRKLDNIWKAITSKCEWSGQLLTLYHLLAQRTPPRRYWSNFFHVCKFPIFCMSPFSLFYPLEYYRPCWVGLLYSWGILTSWVHSWTLLHSPLCLMTYYKRGSMFRMRTSFTIIITCLPWVSPKMEGHFGWPRRFILWFFKHW